MVLVGKSYYSGEYQGKAYHGVRLFVTYEGFEYGNSQLDGLGTDIVKVSSSSPAFSCVSAIPLGASIRVIYNKFQSPVEICVLDNNEKGGK